LRIKGFQAIAAAVCTVRGTPLLLLLRHKHAMRPRALKASRPLLWHSTQSGVLLLLLPLLLLRHKHAMQTQAVAAAAAAAATAVYNSSGPGCTATMGLPG
jgi:hypothetical protein